MPASSRYIRARFPRTLIEKLTARAAAENTDINSLIINAVKANLRSFRRVNAKKHKIP